MATEIKANIQSINNQISKLEERKKNLEGLLVKLEEREKKESILEKAKLGNLEIVVKNATTDQYLNAIIYKGDYSVNARTFDGEAKMTLTRTRYNKNKIILDAGRVKNYALTVGSDAKAYFQIDNSEDPKQKWILEDCGQQKFLIRCGSDAKYLDGKFSDLYLVANIQSEVFCVPKSELENYTSYWCFV